MEAEASIQRHGPSLCRLALQGGLRFGLVSVGVFLFWAVAGGWLNRQIGELGFYSACALLFILLSGIALKPLVPELSIPGFYFMFAGAFFAYAFFWCLCWFMAPNRWGSLAGSLVGTSAMAAVFCWRFKSWKQGIKIAGLLFVAHTAGYFLGEYLYFFFKGPTMRNVMAKDLRDLLSKLSWGAAYGFGFGVGIGYAFYAKSGSCLGHKNAQKTQK